MSAEEAKIYGLVDSVILKTPTSALDSTHSVTDRYLLNGH